jgi:hypothetical protein
VVADARKKRLLTVPKPTEYGAEISQRFGCRSRSGAITRRFSIARDTLITSLEILFVIIKAAPT